MCRFKYKCVQGKVAHLQIQQDITINLNCEMSEYTQYLVKAEHFDFDQTVTTILATTAALVCIQDGVFKLLNTVVCCCCCGNEDFSCSSKLWKLLMSITEFLLSMTVLYTLYAFDFDANHSDHSITKSEHGFDFDFVCFNTNIVDYVNSISFMKLRYENLLLLWMISIFTNLNYFFEGALQCSIDNSTSSMENQTKKSKIFGVFSILYVLIQIVIVIFMFPVFCDSKNTLKYAFFCDGILTLAVLSIYFAVLFCFVLFFLSCLFF